MKQISFTTAARLSPLTAKRVSSKTMMDWRARRRRRASRRKGG